MLSTLQPLRYNNVPCFLSFCLHDTKRDLTYLISRRIEANVQIVLGIENQAQSVLSDKKRHFSKNGNNSGKRITLTLRSAEARREYVQCKAQSIGYLCSVHSEGE